MKRLCVLVLAMLIIQAEAAGQTPPREIRLVAVAQKLEQPVAITHDGSDRLYIVEQPGRIRVVANRVMRTAPYLKITDRVASGGECGLLGLAFHPDYQSNGLFYVNYTSRRGNLHTVISEFHADPKSFTADPSSERIILTFDQPFANHNGGQVAFGPDGMLYIGTGDGGSANDPQNNGQKTSTLLGKILRIDVSPRDGYKVPDDNPFVNQTGFRPEIWAYGLRNPWRFSFDRQTGVLFAGDVGQNLFEEIDVITRGGNYGWRLREGLHSFMDGKSDPSYIDPVAEYPHSKGLSVTGGYVYRGSAAPGLQGLYIYGDYSSGRIWGLRYEDGNVISNGELNVTLAGRPILNRVLISSFGEDAAGELYVANHNGNIYRLIAD
jgi:glucose/arabinose dehydrogenase